MYYGIRSTTREIENRELCDFNKKRDIEKDLTLEVLSTPTK